MEDIDVEYVRFAQFMSYYFMAVIVAVPLGLGIGYLIKTYM